MRQAKEEADAEVAAYRAQREATYQKMLAEVRARTHPLSAPQIRRVPETDHLGRANPPYPLPETHARPPSSPFPLSQQSGDSTTTQAKMMSESEGAIATMRAQVAGKKKAVIDILNSRVTAV